MVYDRYLGPLLFQPYAEDLAARLQVDKNTSVLELACGTGILTRVLRTRLPSTVELIATDLNEPMFRHAAAKFRKDEAVQWLQADACSLLFGDQLLDAVVCQFGIMFVPDKALAAREAHRVLKPGGLFLFNGWRRNGARQAGPTHTPDDCQLLRKRSTGILRGPVRVS